MKRFLFKSVILTAAMLLLCLPAQAAKNSKVKTNHAASVTAKALAYSVPSESRTPGAGAMGVEPYLLDLCWPAYPWSFGPPDYVTPGVQLDKDLTFENCGTEDLYYTITVIEDNGPSGWLAVSGFTGFIPYGEENTETGTVHLNYGGIVTEPGTYYGRLHVEGNFPSDTSGDIEVELWVTEGEMLPVYDEVNTNCLSLTASTYGNMGHSGIGQVNMDYYPQDCDSTAKTYMWDGSPLYGRIAKANDTLFNSSIWGTNWYEENGFLPGSDYVPAAYCESLDAEVFETGEFSDHDGTMGFEKIYVAPSSECNFIIQHMRVWSADGIAHDDIMLGEAIDWDIPTDYLVDDIHYDYSNANSGGVDGARGLVYIQGYEAYGEGSDTLYPFNCQYNDNRFGGQAFVESYLNDAMRAPMAYSGFVGENDSMMADYLAEFEPGTLYWEMVQSGFRATDSIEDLHTVMCFEPALDLGGSDVYEVVTVLATLENGTLADFQTAIDAGKAWYLANGGMDMFDDLDGDGKTDLCEGCCQVMGKWFSDGSGFTLVDINDFVAWLWRGGEIYDCLEQVDIGGPEGCGHPDGSVDVLDLNCMTGFLFRLGPRLGECP